MLLGTLMVALSSIFFVLGQGSRREGRQDPTPPLPMAAPEEPGTRVALSTTVARRKREDDANFSAEPDGPSNTGGPDGYKDSGLDSADPRLAPAPTSPPTPPAPVKRSVQGPER